MLPYATHLFTSLGAQNHLHPILNTPTEAKQIVILGALCVCVCVCVCVEWSRALPKLGLHSAMARCALILVIPST